MAQPIFLVDAFAHAPFTGNPAGVCPLDHEPEEDWMRKVAMEMNQAETAFFWPEGDRYRLRWFTPAVEVDLCGHATLATAHVLFSLVPSLAGSGGGPGWGHPQNSSPLVESVVTFVTRSGELVCRKTAQGIEMDFPNEEPSEVEPFDVTEALGVQPVWMGANRMDWFFVLESADQLLALSPDFRKVHALGKRGVIVTSRPNFPTSELEAKRRPRHAGAPNPRTSEPPNAPTPDFLSRFFAPQSGIDEDPVTGSAHCALGPYWSRKLGKETVTGYQASKRGGYVTITPNGDRVTLSGQAQTVLKGELV